MTVDVVVEAIFRRLCLRQRHQGVGADMSLVELRLALGVTEAQLIEAVKVARISDDCSSRSRHGTGARWGRRGGGGARARG